METPCAKNDRNDVWIMTYEDTFDRESMHWIFVSANEEELTQLISMLLEIPTGWSKILETHSGSQMSVPATSPWNSTEPNDTLAQAPI